MKQFCKDVLEFLRSEYDDAYRFEIELQLSSDSAHQVVELSILAGPGYKIKIKNKSMQYIFNLYVSNEYIGERNQYRWQKELIDIIEGG
jgi:hypothetical protein